MIYLRNFSCNCHGFSIVLGQPKIQKLDQGNNNTRHHLVNYYSFYYIFFVKSEKSENERTIIKIPFKQITVVLKRKS